MQYLLQNSNRLYKTPQSSEVCVVEVVLAVVFLKLSLFPLAFPRKCCSALLKTESEHQESWADFSRVVFTQFDVMIKQEAVTLVLKQVFQVPFVDYRPKSKEQKLGIYCFQLFLKKVLL